MAAILLSQTNPVRVELFSYEKTIIDSNKFAWLLASGGWKRSIVWWG